MCWGFGVMIWGLLRRLYELSPTSEAMRKLAWPWFLQCEFIAPIHACSRMYNDINARRPTLSARFGKMMDGAVRRWRQRAAPPGASSCSRVRSFHCGTYGFMEASSAVVATLSYYLPQPGPDKARYSFCMLTLFKSRCMGSRLSGVSHT